MGVMSQIINCEQTGMMQLPAKLRMNANSNFNRGGKIEPNNVSAFVII